MNGQFPGRPEPPRPPTFFPPPPSGNRPAQPNGLPPGIQSQQQPQSQYPLNGHPPPPSAFPQPPFTSFQRLAQLPVPVPNYASPPSFPASSAPPPPPTTSSWQGMPPTSGYYQPGPPMPPAPPIPPSSQPPLTNGHSVPGHHQFPPQHQHQQPLPGQGPPLSKDTAQRMGMPPRPPGFLPGPPPQPGPPQVNGYSPGPPQAQRPPDLTTEQMARLSLANLSRPVDLLATRDLLPGPGLSQPTPAALPAAAVENPEAFCDPAIFRSTLGVVPGTQDMLKKCRLPLGLILHPFKDLKSLTILQVSQIVRCRACRTYINPFATLSDHRHWRCNICFRVNDLPEDFSWDPVTKSYGEPQRRPEIRHATIEFIAPSEYMPVRKNLEGKNELRPPQPACYVFVLDVSQNAVETGYLSAFVATFLNCLDRIPGDQRALIGFITVNSSVHFYQFPGEEDSENILPPRQLVVSDLDEIFLPVKEDLLVSLHKCRESVREFVSGLAALFEDTNDNGSGLGAALKAATDLVRDIGARVTVFQSQLPDKGPGALTAREDPNLRASSDVSNLGPATDFYKQLALECSGHQIALDLFLMASAYADVATLSGMAKFCGGVIHYYPSLHFIRNSLELRRFEKDFARYLTRKIGFESVLRIRCTKGLALHTFHGNFFVRSTDLLALPNTNPDTALGVSVQMEESIADLQTVSFQSALLYTSSRGDRRIRVHTLCLPVSSSLSEIQAKADPEALVSLLAKMAVERSVASGSITDAREALVHAVVDALGAYAASLPATQRPPANALPAPPGHLRLFPLYILALLKHHAFSHGTSVKLDLRVFSMCQFRTLPLRQLILEIYPALYPLHSILDCPEDTGPPQLQLSYARIEQGGLYALDTGSRFYLYLTLGVSSGLLAELLGVEGLGEVEEDLAALPELANPFSARVREFLATLQAARPFHAPLRIIREDSKWKEVFCRRLVEDKSESAHSFVEFLQHIRREMGSK